MGFARETHKPQDPSGECVEMSVGGGGEVLVPSVEEAVMEPSVMRTMSEGWT